MRVGAANLKLTNRNYRSSFSRSARAIGPPNLSLCTGAAPRARRETLLSKKIVRALAAVDRVGGRGNTLRVVAQKFDLNAKGSQPSATRPTADPS